jgi:hypothetical protein
MKPLQTSKSWRRFSALVGGFALFTGALQAAPFVYTQGDLVLAFRQTGNNRDYIVNIGKATSFNNVPANTTINITNFSYSQFALGFPSDLNGVSWSVVGANRLPDLNPSITNNTLWATKARLDPATQSGPWERFGFYSQGSSGALFDVVGQNARDYSSSIAASTSNTVYGVIIPTSSDYAFTPVITTGGNYDGGFQGSVENDTAADFTSDAANVSRSDLYELLPRTADGQLGRYLGFFELKGNGTLTFKTTAAGPARPNITSITRSGSISTVSFTTTSGYTHRLRFTTALGTPVSTWSIGNSLSGTGSVQSLQHTTTSANTFYAVEALP